MTEDIDRLVQLITTEVSKILQGKMVALYLTGSLANRDFNEDSSDIDLVCILSEDMTEQDADAIANTYDDICTKYPGWKKRIEHSFIPAHMISSKKIPKLPRYYFNNQCMHLADYGYEWVHELYALHYGKLLSGNCINDKLADITITDLQQAIVHEVEQNWDEIDRKLFIREGYDSSHLQAYYILTMCRMLFTVISNTVGSKVQSANWVKSKYSEWSKLISDALTWQHGSPLEHETQAVKFLNWGKNKILNEHLLSP